ncbi:hypothetical protein [Aquibacillus halophilus]|uniref:hypothetical protein n=1 Tax=Aquibacillus halophilus TaxID=930132 RepID=UPI00147901CC|nr:hypothetical protein [Aquibacillus halophilus]
MLNYTTYRIVIGAEGSRLLRAGKATAENPTGSGFLPRSVARGKRLPGAQINVAVTSHFSSKATNYAKRAINIEDALCILLSFTADNCAC